MAVTNLSDIYNTGSTGSGSVGMDQVHAKWRPETYTLSLTDITNGYITLLAEPKTATKVKLEITEGFPAVYGVDFTVSTALKRLSWSGLALDGSLAVGDKLRVTYFEV